MVYFPTLCMGRSSLLIFIHSVFLSLLHFCYCFFLLLYSSTFWVCDSTQLSFSSYLAVHILRAFVPLPMLLSTLYFDFII
ncbi:hypothetical protein C8R41DRAFT_514510 [Lentinula lateritia]|uniref:Uncharacterized protein n=1 Tax=Lentinula lateritia TaxID=40482 RepID=A0ABQ8V9K5_9AGAR|nr:hypothetical protein C8R41DRAFT_514510 [Lentinula lateritia]